MPLLFTRKDVENVLTMKDAIAAVEEGFRQLALGKVIMPQRTAIRVSEHHGIHLGMPAYIGGATDRSVQCGPPRAGSVCLPGSGRHSDSRRGQCARHS